MLEIMAGEGGRRPGWRRNPDLWFPTLLALLGILFFSDFLFSSKNFYFRDILNLHYPLRRILIDCYARGEWPLWNPYIYLGQPLLANPNYLAFYPTGLLHALFPFNYAFKLHFMVHPILGGIGMYFLGRQLMTGSMAAFGGALAYQFSGTVLSFMNLFNIIPTVAMLPWIGWAFLSALVRGARHRILLFGALLALQLLVLEPLMFECTLVLIIGLAVYHFCDFEDRRRAGKNVIRVGAAGAIIAFGLAAIQLLPTLELLPLSARAGAVSYDMATTWSLHPMDLLNSVIPNLFGNPFTVAHQTEWGEAFHDGVEGFLVSVFLGISTIVLAAISLGSRRSKLKYLLGGLVAASLLLALGKYGPIYRWLYEHIPVFQLGRYPVKYFLLTTLALCLMAALGLERLAKREPEPLGRERGIDIIGALCFLIGFVLLGLWLIWHSNPSSLESSVRAAVLEARKWNKDYPEIVKLLLQSLLSSAAFAIACGGLLVSRRFLRQSERYGVLFVLLVGTELVPANIRLSPSISNADMSHEAEINRFLGRQMQREPSRVMPPATVGPLPAVRLYAPNRSAAWLNLFYRMSGQPSDGLFHGIQYSLSQSVDILNTRESEKLHQSCLSLPLSRKLDMMRRLNTPFAAALEPIGVPGAERLASFGTLSDHPVHVYRVRDVLPRAFFVQNVDSVGSQEDALRHFIAGDFPYSTSVILENTRNSAPFSTPNGSSVQVVAYENNYVRCEVQSSSPGFLVLLDSYYPGWAARLDGAPAEILRANYAFRAVRLPSGFHKIEFFYRPSSFYIGLALSLITFVGLIFYRVDFFRKKSGNSEAMHR